MPKETTQAKNEWSEFFNGHAPVYEENCFTKNTIAEADFLVEELRLKPAMRILDVGCGTGRHSIELARRGLDVTGLDISPGMLERARANAAKAGVTVTWVQSDAKSFAFADPFDAAICLCEGSFGLLGAADDPVGQPLAILRNIAAALKPGAPCIMTVLNGYKLARQHTNESVRDGRFDPLALAERSDVGGATTLRERAFVPTELALLCANAGIEVTNIWGGTAGSWGRRPIELDEFEIMLVGRRAATPPQPPYPVFAQH